MNVLYGLISLSELLKEQDSNGNYTFAGITQKTFLGLQESQGEDAALIELGNRITHNLNLTENIIEFLLLCSHSGSIFIFELIIIIFSMVN